MPIYDFKCTGCGHRFEQLVKPGESPDCPACGASKPERQFPFSATVSTGKTRERAAAPVRDKARAMKREQDHAHGEYLRKHHEDHS
jgi:putative FmdB family regulatory protein